MKSNTQLRQESIKRVLLEIRKRGPISKRELQAVTGFSWGNISSITTLLLNENYIMASGKQETSVGRRPEELDININDNYIIGIDFNCEGVLAVVCDLRGRIISKYSSVFEEKSKAFALEKFFALIGKIKEEYKNKRISHIALAMQGEVDVEQGISVKISAIEGWRNVKICELLENTFGIKTVMLHDPDCLLYTEKHFGLLGEEINNAVLLRIDHGIGIACMLGGKMYLGNGSKTCEIGTTVVPTSNGWKLLKSIVKESAVEKNYNEITGMDMNCSAIAAMAQNGETNAVRVFANLGNALGFALNNVVSLFNPENIILYGDFTKYNELFLKETKGVLEVLLGEEAPKIMLSTLDNIAAAVGAALFAADNVIDESCFIN